MRLDSRIDGDPLDVFLAGVEALRPDRAAYLKGPWGAVASLSPELFLERRGDHVRSAPIKGTIRKPADPHAAARARETLRTSAKDRAENVMIVDLVRNDLGRVCRPGTVTADVIADPRAHTGVWHLVSEVSGRLAPGADNAALVRAAFPPGSVTGAPKVAALNVISELESTSRHVYTGAIGFASPLAGLELNVAIRTFEFAADHERVWLGVGGGIVADSDPAAEAAECLTKATPLLDAIGASVAHDDDHRRTAATRRDAPTRQRASSRPGTHPGRSPAPTPRPACSKRCSSSTDARSRSTNTSPGWPTASSSCTPRSSRPSSPRDSAPSPPPTPLARAYACASTPDRTPTAAPRESISRSRASRFAGSRQSSTRSSSPAVSAPTSGSTGACSTPSERRPIRSSAISTARSWKRPAPTSSS